MLRILIVGVIIVLAVFAAKNADAQYYYNRCWGCYPAPFIAMPPVVVAPPIVIAPPPVFVAPQPIIVEQPAPAWYYFNGRRCWQQYAGSDQYGQPMYIQACD